MSKLKHISLRGTGKFVQILSKHINNYREAETKTQGGGTNRDGLKPPLGALGSPQSSQYRE